LFLLKKKTMTIYENNENNKNKCPLCDFEFLDNTSKDKDIVSLLCCVSVGCKCRCEGFDNYVCKYPCQCVYFNEFVNVNKENKFRCGCEYSDNFTENIYMFECKRSDCKCNCSWSLFEDACKCLYPCKCKTFRENLTQEDEFDFDDDDYDK
jgi:hypothetical protein